MTRDELDILWSVAMHEAIKAGEDMTRYHFAALLRNRMIAAGWRQCAQGQRTTQFCALVEQARQEEREACLAEIEMGIWFDKSTDEILDSIAAAIRARGQA